MLHVQSYMFVTLNLVDMDAEEYTPDSNGVSTLDPYVSGWTKLQNDFQRPLQSVQTSNKQMKSSDNTTSGVTPKVVPYQEPPLKKRFCVMNAASKVSYFLLVCAIILILSAVAHTIYHRIVGEEEKSPTKKTDVAKESNTSPYMNSTMKTCLCINGK